MASNDKTDFFESVLHCVADGVFTVDCDWRITSFNRAAERITGVYVLDLDTLETRLIRRGVATPTWSPDGT